MSDFNIIAAAWKRHPGADTLDSTLERMDEGWSTTHLVLDFGDMPEHEGRPFPWKRYRAVCGQPMPLYGNTVDTKVTALDKAREEGLPTLCKRCAAVIREAHINSKAGRLGCIQLRTVRQTGRPVGVYFAPLANMDPGKGRHYAPWYTVCEDHGEAIAHKTKTLALRHAPVPLEWCEECREEQCR